MSGVPTFAFITFLFMAITLDVYAKVGDTCLSDALTKIQNNNFDEASDILRGHAYYMPDDNAEKFLLAKVLSWQKLWKESLHHFDILLNNNPNDADILLARANTHDWMGNSDAALLDLDVARLSSPDYKEVWRTQLSILSRHKNSKGLQLAYDASQRFAGDDWQGLGFPLLETESETIMPLEAKPIKNNIVNKNKYVAALTNGHSDLNNNRSSWRNTSLYFSIRTEKAQVASLSLDSLKRFNLEDYQLVGRYTTAIDELWGVSLETSYSSTHQFLANWKAGVNLSRKINDSSTIHIGFNQASYTQSNSNQIHLSAEKYWSDYRFAYTYKHINVSNAGNGFNHKFQINYYISNHMVGFLAANGEDIEFDGTTNPPISHVITYSIFGQHNFSPHWWLNYAFDYHQQGNFYNLNGLSLGLKYDF